MEWRKVHADGAVIIVRYTDYFVLGFQHRDEAESFLKQFAAANRKRNGAGNPETFNFLGSTHICSTIHKSGKFTVHRKTVGKRMTAKLHDVAAQLRKRINDPIEQTGDWLNQVVRGYFTSRSTG
jgi:hypothetical protein